MSVQAITWVLEHSTTSGNDRCVMIALANRFDAKEPDRCYPGVATIAAEANVSERTAQRCLDRCVETGELLVFRGAGGSAGMRGDRRPNLYVMPALTDWRPETGCQSDAPQKRRGVSPRAPRGDNVDVDGASTGAPRGVTAGTNGVSLVTPDPTGDPTEDPTGDPTRTPPAADAAAAEPATKVDKLAAAKAIVDPWWEERRDAGNPVGQGYIACVKVVDVMLRNKVPTNRIEWALRNSPVVSTGALEMAIQRRLRGNTNDSRTHSYDLLQDRIAGGAP